MEIAVISGKGGTGKSSISAAFATLEKGVVAADCDVDAANLHLLFDPVITFEEKFTGGEKAIIDQKLCFNCGLCEKYCRFDAISRVDDRIQISDIYCDGCGLCARVCPAEAISMKKIDESRLYSGSFRNGMMVWGRLAPGEENSGKLVSRVREKAKQIAEENDLTHIILDGPPGIGCPVLSTVTGVDGVVIVTEPTLSGLHDLQRTVELVSGLRLKKWVIINKADLSPPQTEQIEAYCHGASVPVLARIPFDRGVVEAMVLSKTIPEHLAGSETELALRSAWEEIKKTFL